MVIRSRAHPNPGCARADLRHGDGYARRRSPLTSTRENTLAGFYLISDPQSGSALRGAEQPRPETADRIVVDQVGGAELADIVWTDGAAVCVSSRLVRTLAVNALTGWESEEADLRLKSGRVLSDYQALRVVGRAKALDWSACEAIAQLTSEGRSVAYLGVRVDRSTHDGSDVFRVGDDGPLLVSERVARAFEHAKVSNVALRPLHEIPIGEHQDQLVEASSTSRMSQMWRRVWDSSRAKASLALRRTIGRTGERIFTRSRSVSPASSSKTGIRA